MDGSETIAAIEAKKGIDLDIRQIMALIPHRFPMLMIDKIVGRRR